WNRCPDNDLRRRLIDEADEQLGQIRRSDAVIDGDALERVRGHAAADRIGRILDDRYAARLFDRLQPGGAVVQRAAEDDTDDARTEMVRGGSEQRIDRRA